MRRAVCLLGWASPASVPGHVPLPPVGKHHGISGSSPALGLVPVREDHKDSDCLQLPPGQQMKGLNQFHQVP